MNAALHTGSPLKQLLATPSFERAFTLLRLSFFAAREDFFSGQRVPRDQQSLNTEVAEMFRVPCVRAVKGAEVTENLVLVAASGRTASRLVQEIMTNIKRVRITQRDVKNEDSSGDVYENKWSSDTMADNQHDFLAEDAQIER